MSKRSLEVIKCDDALLKAVFMANYDLQLDAGLGVISQIALNLENKIDEPDIKVLIFGMGGTGKSLYPRPLLEKMCKNQEMQAFLKEIEKRSKLKLEFPLFYISCLNIIDQHKDFSSLTSFLDKLGKDLEKKSPALVVLDELDAFFPERIEESKYVNTWTMHFMKKNHQGKGIFGILNHPITLDQTASREFTELFYFDLPDEPIVSQILHHFGIPHHEEMARKLCTDPVDPGELVKSCKYAIQFRGGGDPKNLAKLEMEDLGDFIKSRLKTPWKKVWDYENKNTSYIDKAREHMDFWQKRKEALLKPRAPKSPTKTQKNP